MTLRRLPRPQPRETRLQAALRCFADALAHAEHDPRTHRVFCDIAAVRIAREYARHLEERRP